MAGTAEVLSLIEIEPVPKTNYSVLVPNQKGLDLLLDILSPSTSPDSAAKPPPPVTEVAIFASATDAFSLANTNIPVSGSLERLAPVARAALDAGLKVRGYVSVVITCPYSGRVDPRRVRDVSRELMQMGCYEVSLGDTTGAGTPVSVRAMLEEVAKEIDVGLLGGHVSFIRLCFLLWLTRSRLSYSSMILMARRSQIFKLLLILGCGHSMRPLVALGDARIARARRATLRRKILSMLSLEIGYLAISVNHTVNIQACMFHLVSLYIVDGEPAKTVQSQWDVGPIDLTQLAEIGQWISGLLGRETTSRAGRALLARRKREEERKRKESAKL
jgi:hydroxymethylglutaryl-CoA lyase